MKVRSVRIALLAAVSLLLLMPGANLLRPNSPPDLPADLAATDGATDDGTYSMVAARAAAQSSSVWQLLSAQR